MGRMKDRNEPERPVKQKEPERLTVRSHEELIEIEKKLLKVFEDDKVNAVDGSWILWRILFKSAMGAEANEMIRAAMQHVKEQKKDSQRMVG